MSLLLAIKAGACTEDYLSFGVAGRAGRRGFGRVAGATVLRWLGAGVVIVAFPTGAGAAGVSEVAVRLDWREEGT